MPLLLSLLSLVLSTSRICGRVAKTQERNGALVDAVAWRAQTSRLVMHSHAAPHPTDSQEVTP